MDLISRQQFFGATLFSKKDRITRPLLKQADGSFVPIGFDEAFAIIAEKVRQAEPDRIAFFGGARLTNEELYLIQKWARAGVKTNNVSSFHYFGRGDGYFRNSNENAPFCDLRGASRVYVAGGELQLDHPIINHILFNTRFREKIEIVHLTTLTDSLFSQKADRVIRFGNYFYFLKAVNYYLLKHGMENALFLNDRTQGFDDFRTELLACDFDKLVSLAGSDKQTIAGFAQEYNEEMNAVVVFQEKELSSNACLGMHQLAMITGKLGKTANGLVSLKEKVNSHGIIDMGMCHKIGPGADAILDEDLQHRLTGKWGVNELPFAVNSVYKLITGGRIDQAYIFGEDPIGCALDKNEVKQWFNRLKYVVVQDLYMTETALKANLVLPASLPWEIGGSLTNSQRRIQQIGKQLNGPVAVNSFSQLTEIMKHFGLNGFNSPAQVLEEVFSLLPKRGEYKELRFVYKEKDNANRMFAHGCDVLGKMIDMEFAEKLQW
jgi:formate dehydrogenase major subunit